MTPNRVIWLPTEPKNVRKKYEMEKEEIKSKIEDEYNKYIW